MALSHLIAAANRKAKRKEAFTPEARRPISDVVKDVAPVMARATVERAGKDILLENVPAAMLVRLEEERKRRGLRSRAETIRVLLSEALK